MAVPACFNTRGDFIPPVSRRRRRRWVRLAEINVSH